AVSALLGLLAVGLAALLVLRARRGRRPADADAEHPTDVLTAVTQVPADPLVRRRETAFDEVPDDDFDVVMRSSREEAR
ncbi:MAG TPA: hypothetical protein VF587_15310, partial [Solirubrobacteraceae bacterium]